MEKNCKLIVALVRQKLISLVAKDDLEGASGLLSELAEICDERRADEVAILRRGISEITREQLLGKVGFKEASEVKNRLADRLLGIANSFSQNMANENDF